MSATRDVAGEWQWFARYNLGDFDISREVNASAPYLTYLYSGGGPGGCDEGNSDGFDLMDYEIYVKLP